MIDNDRLFQTLFIEDRDSAMEIYHNYMFQHENDLLDPITRSAFTAGEGVMDYLEAFDVDLFLTIDINDA